MTEWIIAGAAIGALGVSIYNSVKIREIHITFNSRMSEFIKLVEVTSEAKGLKQGRDESR